MPSTTTQLTFRLKQGEPIELTPKYRDLLRLANHWDFRMRNRSRWIAHDSARRRMEELSRLELRAIGVTDAILLRLSRAQVVEVFLHMDLEAEETAAGFAKIIGVVTQVGWRSWVRPVLERKLRKVPWEALLNEAAQKYRDGRRLVVYRRIKGDENYTAPVPPLRALFVETAPGPLASGVDFSREFKAVKSYSSGLDWGEALSNPTLDELEARIKSDRPVVIHISGYDGFQGSEKLRELAEQEREQTDDPQPSPAGPATSADPSQARPQGSELHEGMYFRGSTGQPVLVTPEKLSQKVCASDQKPLLVTYNTYNSSARMAAAAVDNGAAAAIGFQDFIDDTVAEIFFASLFRFWSGDTGTSLLDAFRKAILELVEEPETSIVGRKVRGSGINLWTRVPLFGGSPESSLAFPVAPSSVEQPPPVRPDLAFDIVPYPRLNYSVLHNSRQQIFKLFRIYKFSPGPVDDLRVDVTLSVGGDRFEFKATFSMSHHILDLSEDVRVGLTSTLSRSLRESVRTTVFVRVAHLDVERYRATFGISLLAVDEWIDDDFSGIFLPSFVLPRDPIVPKVLSRAQGYLMAIADDIAQGFDGYQSVDACPEDPTAALEPQVRALWYALQHDYALRYINPPPTFTESSQRLRTPTEILSEGRGTCIDLALLIAACLELIGLHPVVFLLTGHAFAGYWTDERRRDDFCRGRAVEESDSTKAMVALADKAEDPTQTLSELDDSLKSVAEQEGGWEIGRPPVEWKFSKVRWKEIVDAVSDGSLVAVEATYLTNGGSFSEACATGAENLNDCSAFDSMMDITLAREYDVTPLPIANGVGEDDVAV